MKPKNTAEANACYKTAEEYYKAKNYAEAWCWYTETIVHNSEHTGALYSLAWLYEHNLGLNARWRMDKDDLLMNLIAGRYYYVHPVPNADGNFEIRSKWRGNRNDIALVYYKRAAELGHAESARRYASLTHTVAQNKLFDAPVARSAPANVAVLPADRRTCS